MKKTVFITLVAFVALYLLVHTGSQDKKVITQKYPWQVKILPGGRTQVFGIVLGETTLKEANKILNSRPEVALFESNKRLSLEAYYKNVSLGRLIGSFVFTIDAPQAAREEFKNTSIERDAKKKGTVRYSLDKQGIEKAKSYIVSSLIYLPAVQLDEEMIVKRFGKPAQKIKLKTKEAGWHYLYPQKGLDLIYKVKEKEVLQYVQPKDFNVLLAPLQTDQNQKH